MLTWHMKIFNVARLIYKRKVIYCIISPPSHLLLNQTINNTEPKIQTHIYSLPYPKQITIAKMSSRLSYRKLLEILEQPEIKIDPATAVDQEVAESIQCPVCLMISTKMLKHSKCGQWFCTSCIKQLIYNLPSGVEYWRGEPTTVDCPNCRQIWIEFRPNPQETDRDRLASKTKLMPLVQTEAKIHESITFKCPNCVENFHTSSVSNHKCQQTTKVAVSTPQTYPDTYIRSNGAKFEWEGLNENRMRLCTLSLNGKGIFTGFFSRSHTIRQLKEKISRVTGVNVESFQLFKFTHNILDQNALIGTLHPGKGKICIQAFSSGILDDNSIASIKFTEIHNESHIHDNRRIGSLLSDEGAV